MPPPLSPRCAPLCPGLPSTCLCPIPLLPLGQRVRRSMRQMGYGRLRDASNLSEVFTGVQVVAAANDQDVREFINSNIHC